jgi:hypothetical protein
MRTKLSFLFALLLASVFAQSSLAHESAEVLTSKVVSENAPESSAAISELRAMGPTGLSILRERYAKEIDRHVTDPSLLSSREWQRIVTALDAVSQQKDSYISGLYWYTDLQDARKASRDSGKPILSLRLLGKLSEEFSCANSRFFRTVLYSNAQVAAALRERFILHWQSVRPAPRVTIDFGDGRKLERTLTGNSIHYILDSAGRPIDALPGLYGPQAFLRGLGEAEGMFKNLQGQDQNKRQRMLASYYSDRGSKINIDWLAETTKLGGKLPLGVIVQKDQNGKAIAIGPLAVTKMITEGSILRSIIAGTEALGRITDESAWKQIALLHLADAKLDDQSIGLIKRQTQNLPATTGDGLSPAKRFDNLVQTLELSIAMDTVRNEYLLHTKLYGMLTLDPSRDNVDKLNEKVYAELFLTPRSDAWLGLFSPEIYTALENGGVIQNPER